jgi:hypothetical protein
MKNSSNSSGLTRTTGRSLDSSSTSSGAALDLPLCSKLRVPTVPSPKMNGHYDESSVYSTVMLHGKRLFLQCLLGCNLGHLTPPVHYHPLPINANHTCTGRHQAKVDQPKLVNYTSVGAGPAPLTGPGSMLLSHGSCTGAPAQSRSQPSYCASMTGESSSSSSNEASLVQSSAAAPAALQQARQHLQQHTKGCSLLHHTRATTAPSLSVLRCRQRCGRHSSCWQRAGGWTRCISCALSQGCCCSPMQVRSQRVVCKIVLAVARAMILQLPVAYLRCQPAAAVQKWSKRSDTKLAHL